MSVIKYRPEIDGLRALAVIPVVLFHFGTKWLPGGFIGVDVFFVISGYLITSIIIKDFDRDAFSFIGFWQRRIRRILPALITMVIATSIAGQFILYGPDIRDLGKQGISALLSYANINLWLTTGNYWGAQAENSPLLHTWSLSVEEQFYLIFPFLLIFLLKYYRERLIPLLSFIIILSISLFIYGSLNNPTATFYLLPTRAWELGCGSLTAILAYRYKTKFSNNSFLSFIGLLAIIISYLFVDGEAGLSAYLLIPVIGSVLVIAFSKDEECIINRALSNPPMLYIGRISYSVYLWHWPVLVLSKDLSPKFNNAFFSAYIMLSIVSVSIASYHFIEQTTRRNLKIIPLILLVFIGSISYSSFLSAVDFPEDISFYSKTTWNGQLYNVSPNQEWSESAKKRMGGIIIPLRDHPEKNAYAKGGILKIYGKDKPEIVVLGDSHALMWAKVIDEVCQESGISVSFYAADATPTFFEIPIKKKARTINFSSDEKFVFDKSRIAYLSKWKPKVVVISALWSNEKDMLATQDLIEFIEELGSKILLIEQPPELFFGDKNTPKYLSSMGLLPEKNTKKFIADANDNAYQKGRSLIRELSNKYPHCDFLPVNDVFVEKNRVWVLEDTDVLYIDDDHLSYRGSLKVKDRLSKKIRDYF